MKKIFMLTDEITNNQFYLSSQDAYYSGYFFSNLILKTLIECKKKEYEAEEMLLYFDEDDFYYCLYENILNPKFILDSAVVPASYLVAKIFFPEIPVHMAIPIQIFHNILFDKDVDTTTSSAIAQITANVIILKSLDPQDQLSIINGALMGIITPVSSGIFNLFSNIIETWE